MNFRSTKAQKLFLLGSIASLFAVSACGVSNHNEGLSTVQTVNLPHTKAKWQSIGNCWGYAFSSWAESLVLQGTGAAVDLSESYISMRHFQYQLLQGVQGELQIGGTFELASALTSKYGYMFEGDFLPNEATETFSKSQKQATTYLNASIKSGLLSKSRSEAIVSAELEKAFGFKTANIESKIRSASDLSVELDPAGTSVKSLASAMASWKGADWPKDWSTSNQTLPYWNNNFTTAQQSLLSRVKRALNDGHPVVLDWLVDFNALDSQGIFSATNLRANGPGRQGYHSVVIEDYTVEGIDPSNGKRFEVGEGDVSPELKTLALKYGKIKAFVVKNSWGGLERKDRASYVRDGEGGYHKLNADYLFSWLQQVDEKTLKVTGSDTGLGRFILPAGY